MDKILLEGLRCRACIGTTPEERATPQSIEIDLELHLDLRPAGFTDEIKDTVDYHALAKRVQEMVGRTRFQLLEKLAEELAADIMASFSVQEVRLRLYKFPESMTKLTRSVGVEITRHRTTAATEN